MAPAPIWKRFLDRQKARIGVFARAQEIERLKAENAAYKHAFETTAAD